MAADMEAVGLSRVHMYEISVYSVLKHINTARMHTISRKFIPLIYRALGKRILSKFQPILCHFISVKSYPLVIVPVLIFY